MYGHVYKIQYHDSMLCIGCSVDLCGMLTLTGAGEVFSMLDHNGRALVDKLSNEASHTAAHR